MCSPRWLLPVIVIGSLLVCGWGTAVMGQQPQDSEEEIVAEAEPVVSLIYRGKLLEEWIDQLADEDPYRQAAASEALQEIGKPAIQGLIDALKNEDVQIRQSAAEILGEIGAITPEVVPSLIEVLKDTDQQVRETAAEALARIGVKAEEPPEEERPKGEELRRLWVLPEERRLANLSRFGEEMFVRAGVEAAQPPANIPVAPGYLLGPGDELAIRCWGEAIEHLNTTAPISAEGNIYLPLIGELSVAGENLATIRRLLAEKLQEFYADSQVAVTVATTRVVTVYVTGDVKLPGRYELDGTATVLTALYAAGGPTVSGSLRSIRWLSRGQEPVEIDLYPYLLRGEPLGDQPLRPGDTIFVGSIRPEFGVTGEVQRPARYELTKAITCAEAVQIAGGLTPSAYTQSIEVWRVAEHQQQALINVNLQLPLASGEIAGADFMLQAGDVVVVPPVLPIPENAVRISGAVRRPGIYEVEEGMRVGDLIQKAEGLDEGAYLPQGEIRRLDAHKQYQHISFSVSGALEQEASADLGVNAYDEVRIYYREEVTPFTYVDITGPVQKPDQYQWVEQMTVRDLITQAGGVTDEAYLAQARLLRLQADGNRAVVKVELAEALQGDTDANIVLEPADILKISTQEEAIAPRWVHIDGFVQRPDSYKYYAGMKISGLIFAAGGLQPGAGHTVEHTHGRQSGRPKVQQIKLIWEREDQVTVEPDIVLKPDDQVAVIGVGDFKQQAEVITVQGQVANPGAYILHSSTEKSETVYDLLQRAGPLLAGANVDGLIVYRPTEKAMAASQRQNLEQIMRMYNRESASPVATAGEELRRAAIGQQAIVQAAEILSKEGVITIGLPPRIMSLANWITGIPIEGQNLLDSQGQEGDVPLHDGDTIFVPRLKSTVAVLGAVVRQGTVLYRPKAKLAAYINEAGGPTDDAALQRAVVIRANSATCLASDVREIKPGDIILIPSDYMLRTIHTQTGFERVLRSLAPILGALLLAK